MVMEVDGLQPKVVHHIFVSSLKRAKRFASLPNFLLLLPFLMIKKERFIVGRYLFLVWNSIPGSCFCLTSLAFPLLSLMQDASCKLQVAIYTLPFCSFLRNKVPLNEENIENATDWARMQPHESHDPSNPNCLPSSFSFLQLWLKEKECDNCHMICILLVGLAAHDIDWCHVSTHDWLINNKTATSSCVTRRHCHGEFAYNKQ